MTLLICSSTGKSITLLNEIANSGEAKVYRTNENGYLAKIYHSPTPERLQKLGLMIAHPPTEPNSHLNHISFAWPKSALKNAQGDIKGFLMPEIKGGKELIDVYNPQRRKALKLEIDWRFLHTTALNIASIIAALHEASYVLGDIKPQNILVNDRALPSIIDTDSFQVKNPKNGKVYRCLVGSEGYTPPELIGKEFSSLEQTEIHDRFRLAVIIYQLLFGGETPFQGKWTGGGDTPQPNELIRRGLWLYSPNSLIKPVDRTISLEIVHPEIQQCFLRCFNDGHQNPHLRPTAKEWLEALRVGNERLTICGRVDSHYYSRTYGKCYWCDRSTKLGVDIFSGNANSTSKLFPNYSPHNLPSLKSQRFAVSSKKSIQHTYNSSRQNLIKANKKLWWFGFGLILIIAIIQYFPNLSQEFAKYELKEIANSKINTNDAEAYFNRGVARSALGDKQGAIADYTQAININPNLTEPYYNRGNARFDLGDKQEALADYTQAININPNFAQAYQNRGFTRFNLGDKQGAIADYNQAININPNDDQAYNSRGVARFDLGDKQGAIADYNQAININPNNAQAYYNRGNARFDLGDKQEALADYNQAINTNPNYAQAYHNRAVARSVSGDFQGAIADYDQAININPNDAQAYHNRGVARSFLGDIQGAVADYNQAEKMGYK